MIKRTKGERVFNVFNIALMLILSVGFLLPYLMVITASFTDNTKLLVNGYSLFIPKFSVEAYSLLFSGRLGILRAILNSLIVTAGKTVLAVLVNAMFAYPLSKEFFPGKRFFNVLALVTMYISGGAVAVYLNMKSLGLYNSLWVLILPGVAGAWYTLLIKSYYMTIPKSLIEAASIDNANEMQILFLVVLPLSKPILATVALFAAVSSWSNWVEATLWISSSRTDLYPLATVIKLLIDNFTNPTGSSTGVSDLPETQMMNAAVVVSSLPIIMIYPFVQKYFISGMTIGAVKE